jgi:hypothetical protein
VGLDGGQLDARAVREGADGEATPRAVTANARVLSVDREPKGLSDALRIQRSELLSALSALRGAVEAPHEL